jgi:secreted PhoX family phosphatase
MKNPKFHPANDLPLGPPNGESIADLIERGENPRRTFLKGSAAMSMATLLGGGLATMSGRANAYVPSGAPVGGLGFTPVPPSVIPVADRVTVPTGYSVSVLIAWGDPVVAGAPQYNPNLPNPSTDQERQYGMHVDGMHFFPFSSRGQASNDRGLLVVNHEYTDQLLLWNLTSAPASITLEQARTSQAAHGVSVVEIRRTGGQWQVVPNSPYNRRITGNTPCSISGPAAGDALMRTAADPSGTSVLGTLNNCAHGYTPWGTYLTCEENWNGYFGSKTPASDPNLVLSGPSYVGNTSTAVGRGYRRYGVTNGGFGYRWHEVDDRFDVTLNPNEPHRFGWVVEIDPFTPGSVPVKRTALGRIKHESAQYVVGADNTLALYTGDDERNDYLYKFVASAKYNPAVRSANRNLLDAGTLYVARFNSDGTGTWLPLVHGQNGLTAANGFANQAEVLIKTRQAGDRVGATMMDRPEWIAAHPVTREMYLTLTNNTRRGSNPPSSNAIDGSTSGGGARPPVDAANPRSNNIYGHIIRWREAGDDPGATTFEWDIFVRAGDSLNANANLQGDINGDDFGAPDGLWFDGDGRLWIQTDQQGDATGDWVNIGANSMLAADPSTREVRRFLTSPPNCEVTGVCGTPDGRTMFVGIQHPGEDWAGSFTSKSSWPDNGNNGPTTLSVGGAVKPRSATLVITRTGGGKIGAA